MKTAIFSLLCIGAHAFAPSQTAPIASRRTIILSSEPVASDSEASPSSTATATATADAATSSGSKNAPTWEVKQHLYGLDMIKEAEGGTTSVTMGADGAVAGEEALPLPQTYITCGKCKSLFAISEEDLGNKGKGCRVKCSVCDNSWYQSRDRLFDIPTTSHDLLPANKSDLNRVARNLARDIPPHYTGVGKLYVGNLDFSTRSDDLLEFFEKNSPGDVSVCDVSVVIGPDGRSRGFAFVTFYDEADGKAALECNGLECNGRELAVREPNN